VSPIARSSTLATATMSPGTASAICSCCLPCIIRIAPRWYDLPVRRS